MPLTPRRHAVVIGGSLAGLAAARALTDSFETVTVIDRDELPDGADTRKGVPQGRHAHAILAGGALAADRLFPGILGEMIAGGAATAEFNDGVFHHAGGYRAPILAERTVVFASRPYLESHIRRRVGQLEKVTVASGIAVDGLVAEAGRVTGVRVASADGDTRVITADLVVDASGRASQASHWLEAIGYRAPEVDEVRCDMRYASMILRRQPSDLDAAFAVVIESPPLGKRSGFLFPIEGGRWMVTMAASFGTPVPDDTEGFLAMAAALPAPHIYEVLTRAEALTPVMTHRLVSSKQRRYDKVKRLPAGFLAIGDSICSFNPVYGQGMSVALLEAEELQACLAQHGNDDKLARAFYRRAAKVIANPWRIAVGNDFGYPECTGPKPPGTDMVNRYMARVLRAAHVSPEVNTTLVLVQNLLAPPSALFTPAMMLAVRRAARRADAIGHGASTPSPEPATIDA